MHPRAASQALVIPFPSFLVLRILARVVTRAAARWHERHALRLGAAISFYSIFSLAPLLIIVTGAVAMVFGLDAVQGRLAGQLTRLVGENGARALEAVIASAHYRPTEGLIASLFAFALTLLGASGVFVELDEAVGSIGGRTAAPRGSVRSLLWARLHAFALVLGLCFLLLMSLVCSAVLAALQDYIAKDAWPVLTAGGECLNLALLATAFAVLICFLPDPHPSWFGAWVGAFAASLLFTLGKWAVGLYLGRSSVSPANGAEPT
jgi:membrane protein